MPRIESRKETASSGLQVPDDESGWPSTEECETKGRSDYTPKQHVRKPGMIVFVGEFLAWLWQQRLFANQCPQSRSKLHRELAAFE